MNDIVATFKGEDEDEDGEVIGPLIVWDQAKDTFSEYPDWMKQSEAKKIAAQKGWVFEEDV